MAYAVFYQETGEDAIVELSEDYTVADAKEDHPEWRFRHIQKYQTFSGYSGPLDPDYYEGQGEY